MKACVATGERRQMAYCDVPVPTVDPDSLLLRTRCSLICGSDLEYLDGIHGEIQPGQIRGHEFVAEVVETGPDLSTDWQIGDRAVPISYTGNYGCWAEYFVSPTRGVQKVPAHVTDERAVFVEPLHTGYGAVEASGARPGQAAVIIGTGKIGLLAIMSARLVGAAPIIAIDINPRHLEKAREVGAHVTMNAEEVDAVKQVKEITARTGVHPAYHGPEVVIICARQGQVLNQAFEMARLGTHIVLAGFVPPTEIDPGILLHKQLRLSGIMAGRAGQNRINGEIALHMLSYEQIDPGHLISGVRPFSEIQQAIDDTYAGKELSVLLTA